MDRFGCKIMDLAYKNYIPEIDRTAIITSKGVYQY